MSSAPPLKKRLISIDSSDSSSDDSEVSNEATVSNKKNNAYSLEELIELKRLYEEHKVGEERIGTHEKSKRWNKVNEALNEKFGKRSCKMRKSKFGRLDLMNKTVDEMKELIKSGPKTGARTRLVAYSIDEMVDMKRLHGEYLVDEKGIDCIEKKRRWTQLNNELNSKYEVRSLSARQHKFHNTMKNVPIDVLEGKESASTSRKEGHFANYSAEELIDIKTMYEEQKIDENGISKAEKSRRWSVIDEELNQKYVEREKGVRRSKYSTMIKNTSTEELSTYKFVHSKESGASVDYHFEEKKLIKTLAEETIFDENDDDANTVMNDYHNMIQSKEFNGENLSAIPDSLMVKIDAVNWESIAEKVNEQFNNQRKPQNLKRYYTRILLRFDGCDELEESSLNRYSDKQNKMILKAFETCRDENGKLQYEQIKQLFPKCKPKAVYEQYRWLKQDKKMQLDPNEKIEMTPQFNFHYNSLGLLESRATIKSIRAAVDDGECLNDISERYDRPIEFIKSTYRHRNSPPLINNNCPFALCIQKLKTIAEIPDHVEKVHSFDAKLPEVVGKVIEFMSQKEELADVKLKAKTILQNYAQLNMKARKEKRCHINYWLMKEFDTRSIATEKFFNTYIYIGESEFEKRPEEHFVEAIAIESGKFKNTFKQQQLLSGDWIAVVVDNELTKNEAILLEHVGINIGLKNLLNAQSTADSTIYENLNIEESLILIIYVISIVSEKLMNGDYRRIDKTKLKRKANVLLSNKLKNKRKTLPELLDEMPVIRTLNYDTSEDETLDDLREKIDSLKLMIDFNHNDSDN